MTYLDEKFHNIPANEPDLTATVITRGCAATTLMTPRIEI